MSTSKNKIKSSIYSVLKSDHRYNFLSLLQKMVYTYEPDSKKSNEDIASSFLNIEEFSKEHDLTFFSLNNPEDYDYVINDIMKIDYEHKLSEKNKELFDGLYSKFSNKDYIKELYLNAIKDNFGMDNIQDGGLFWLEETDDGLDAIFAHIDDISNLKEDDRNDFLEKIVSNKKKTKNFLEKQVDSPLLKFEGKQFSENDLSKMSPEELSSLTALVIEENNRRYNLKENKLIIKFNNGILEPFLPGIDFKIKEFYPKNKALYFLALLNLKGVKFDDLKKGKYLKNLNLLYKGLHNYEKSDKNSNIQSPKRTIAKMLDKSLAVSAIKSKTNTSIKNHVEGFYPDLNHANHILNDVSFTNEEKYLNIPIDRDKVENLFLIRKLLNNEFTLDDYKIR